MLELHDVSKRYGERLALDDVSFTVGDGRLTGFVGGNGAGKTTTMRIILGVLAADGGSVTLDGAPVTTADRRRFGYMPEERGLYPKMKVLEQIVYLARLHGWTPAAARRNALELLERLGLGERTNDTVETLSLGNQQRAQIAAALVHRPEVLVLDEPFSGLDPIAVETVQACSRMPRHPALPCSSPRTSSTSSSGSATTSSSSRAGASAPPARGEALRTQHSSERYELLDVGDVGWLRAAARHPVVEFDGGYAVFDAEIGCRPRRPCCAEAVARGEVVSFAPQHPTLAQIFKEVVR